VSFYDTKRNHRHGSTLRENVQIGQGKKLVVPAWIGSGTKPWPRVCIFMSGMSSAVEKLLQALLPDDGLVDQDVVR
jgi:hypothetical protein